MEIELIYTNPEKGLASEAGSNGLTVAIQPNLSTAGWPTDAGSRALDRFTALDDATVVQRLRSAGIRICGMTGMSEFGLGLTGSSAGRVVETKHADVELVLDLMGESRVAAVRVGACGFKPSYGLVSRYGVIGLIPSMEAVGLLARRPRSIRTVLGCVAGADERDFSMPGEPVPGFDEEWTVPAGTRIGVIREACSGLTPEQLNGFQQGIEELRAAGCAVSEVSLPDYPLFSLVHKIVGSVEAASSTGRYDSVRYGPRAPGAKNWNEMYLGSRGAMFGTLVKSYLFQGAYFQFENYAAYEDACRIRARLLGQTQRLMQEADYLVLPCPPRGGAEEKSALEAVYAAFAETLWANVTGQPVLALPLPGSAGAVGGIQLMGPRLSDARLLALGEMVLDRREGDR